MTTLFVFKMIGAAFTLLFGIWAIVQPKAAAKGMAIVPYKERGLTEIRTTYGGINLALGAFVLWNQSEVAFQLLAAAYLGAGIIRGAFMFFDKSNTKSNIRIFFIEIIVGIILIL